MLDTQTIDTSSLSTKELMAMRSKMDQEIEDRRKVETQGAMDQIKELVAAHSIDLNRLMGFLQPKGGDKNTKSRSATPLNAPKYRHPETGATWTGRGRRPNWIKAVPDHEVFRIQDQAPQPRLVHHRKAA
jgi:DNA-binding protein H-NS